MSEHINETNIQFVVWATLFIKLKTALIKLSMKLKDTIVEKCSKKHQMNGVMSSENVEIIYCKNGISTNAKKEILIHQ